MIIALAGSSSSIVHRPLPADDPKRRCPDIAKAREVLGWSPRIRLKDGLKKTIAYFESLLYSSVESLEEARNAKVKAS
jgi:UDP-glucuronate decarboxylase